jgi:hypothetical protein
VAVKALDIDWMLKIVPGVTRLEPGDVLLLHQGRNECPVVVDHGGDGL